MEVVLFCAEDKHYFALDFFLGEVVMDFAEGAAEGFSMQFADFAGYAGLPFFP